MPVLHRIVSLLPVLVLLSTLLLPQSALAGATIRVNGTGAGLVVAEKLAAAFARENPGISFAMEKSLGSSASIKAVFKNALDLAISGRPPKPEEGAASLTVREYGKAPFAVVTNREVKVANITTPELAAMYGGRTPRWPGGELVRVVLRPKEDTDTKILRAIAPEMDQAVTAAHARQDMLLGITDQEAFDFVRKTAGALGFMSLSLPLSEPGSVNVAALNGRAPTVANLAAGNYPYAKSIYLVTRKEISPELAKFLKFLNTKKGRNLAAKYGLLVGGV